MFSPKVLDRAFTIEFDQVDLDGFTKGKSSDETSGLTLGGAKSHSTSCGPAPPGATTGNQAVTTG